MRISDWSSVVCSSDLETPREAIDLAQQWRRHRFHCLEQAADSTVLGSGASGRNHAARLAGGDKRTGKGHRSVERRVGKECVSMLISRWRPLHSKKKTNTQDLNTSGLYTRHTIR